MTTFQTAIKIGDSMGVTLPAKELKQLGIRPGDKLKVTFELVEPAGDAIMLDYAEFKAQYGQTLQNLSNR